MSASEFFRTFCVFALVLVNILRKILFKTGLCSRKILGSRVLAARRRSRANYQSFLAQNYFPVTRRPRKKFPRSHRLSMRICEKISQTAKTPKKFPRPRCVSYAEDYWTLPHPPPPGKWAPGPGSPGPLRSESVSGWAQIAIELPPLSLNEV